jgi:hypothetical protein
MRGFLVGTVVLIALYVGVQPRSGKAAAEGSNWVVSGLRRLLSPDVAGVPQRSGGAAKAGSSAPSTGSMSGSRSLSPSAR